MDKREVLERCRAEKVRFMRLAFTDIDGIIKNVEVPEGQFEKALDGQIMFDGSSIEGFTRSEESDMLLKPDLDTFRAYPWETPYGKVARLICDVYNADECFLTGTGAELIPVVKVDGRVIGSGKPGPITKDLVQRYKALTQVSGEPI